MKRKRFTEEQIISNLKEHAAVRQGAGFGPAARCCGEHHLAIVDVLAHSKPPD